MGVRVRQKINDPSMPWWVFVADRGRRWSVMVGSEDEAYNLADQINGLLAQRRVNKIAREVSAESISKPIRKRTKLPGVKRLGFIYSPEAKTAAPTPPLAAIPPLNLELKELIADVRHGMKDVHKAYLLLRSIARELNVPLPSFAQEEKEK